MAPVVAVPQEIAHVIDAVDHAIASGKDRAQSSPAHTNLLWRSLRPGELAFAGAIVAVPQEVARIVDRVDHLVFSGKHGAHVGPADAYLPWRSGGPDKAAVVVAVVAVPEQAPSPLGARRLNPVDRPATSQHPANANFPRRACGPRETAITASGVPVPQQVALAVDTVDDTATTGEHGAQAFPADAHL